MKYTKRQLVILFRISTVFFVLLFDKSLVIDSVTLSSSTVFLNAVVYW